MELIRQELKFFVPSGDRMSGFTESTDVIIPDSYPDFEESIFSCATINVKDELKQPGRVLISGQIDAVILYRSASGNELYRLNVPLSFAHVEDARDIGEGALYFIQYEVSHVDVRIINSRKINVTCTCVIHLRSFEPVYRSLTADIGTDDPGLLTQVKSQAVSMITAAEVKRFVVLDDLELSRQADSAPIHTEVRFGDTDCTVANRKIFLNGTVHLRIWELSENGLIDHHTHEIPFHQILESETLCDNTPTAIRLSCHSAICHYSNSEVFSVNINTEALLLQETEQQITRIDDLYALDRELRPNFQPLSLSTITESMPFSCSGFETMSAPQIVSEIISAESTVCSLLPAEGNDIRCIMAFSVLYLDDTQKLHQLQKQQPVTLTTHASAPLTCITDLICRAEAAPEENRIALRITGNGNATKQETISIQNLEEISSAPAGHTTPHPIRILFIQEPTALWDIAKANRSTPQLIRQYNGLSDDTTEISHFKLLVP